MGFSKALASVFMFGFGLATLGMLITIFKGAFVNRVKDLYWIENTPFLNLMDVEYNIIAIVLLVSGLICMVVAGFESRKEVSY